MFIIYSGTIGFIASWPIWINFLLNKKHPNIDTVFLITIILWEYSVLHPFLFFYFLMKDLKISILQLHFTLGSISAISFSLSLLFLLDFLFGNNFFENYIEKLIPFYFLGGGCLTGYLGFYTGMHFKRLINFITKKSLN